MGSGPNGQSGVPVQNHVEGVKLQEQEVVAILLLSGVGKNVLEKPLRVPLIVRLRAQVHKSNTPH